MPCAHEGTTSLLTEVHLALGPQAMMILGMSALVAWYYKLSLIHI